MEIENIRCGQYQHYKNKKLYEVIGVARHSETHEEMVVYKALYHCNQFGNHQMWVRPKKMFFEEVNYLGKSVPRFKYVNTALSLSGNCSRYLSKTSISPDARQDEAKN